MLLLVLGLLLLVDDDHQAVGPDGQVIEDVQRAAAVRREHFGGQVCLSQARFLLDAVVWGENGMGGEKGVVCGVSVKGIPHVVVTIFDSV